MNAIPSPASRLLRRLVASLPRFPSGFDNNHPLIDDLRNFEDFDDEEIATLREPILTTESLKSCLHTQAIKLSLAIFDETKANTSQIHSPPEISKQSK
jgi:hypothetical protein